MKGYPKFTAVGRTEKGIVPRTVNSSACLEKRAVELFPFSRVVKIVLFIISEKFQKTDAVGLGVAVVGRKCEIHFSALFYKAAPFVNPTGVKLPIIFGLANDFSAVLIYCPRVVHFCDADAVHAAADKRIRKISGICIGVVIGGGVNTVGAGIDKTLKMIIPENILGVRFQAKKPLSVKVAGS